MIISYLLNKTDISLFRLRIVIASTGSKILNRTCNFMMEITVQSSKNEQFCLNFRIPLWASSSEAEWERGREKKNLKGKERQSGIGERGGRQMDWSNDQKAQEGLGPPPHATPDALVHGVKDRIPCISFDIWPPVFVHSSSWPAVFLFYLESFSDFEVVVQFFFVFVSHGLSPDQCLQLFSSRR